MIVDFDSEAVCIDNIDFIINETLNSTRELELMQDEIPSSLSGFVTFRMILRYAKRCGNIDEAVKKYAFDCCPPKKKEKETQCGQIPCNECWKRFIDNYIEETNNKKD